MTDYMILRNGASPRTAEPFDFGPTVGVLSLPNPTRAVRWAGGIQPDLTPAPTLQRQTLSENDVRDVARDPWVAGIARVMPTMLIRPVGESTPAALGPAWGIAAVGAGRSGCTGDGVSVAILDTGIEKAHAAFQDAAKPLSTIEKDFTGTENGDRFGHGTHCAGTVFGRDVSGQRIGVARGVQEVFVGKVLNDQGGGDSHALFAGLLWAVLDCAADVISMSLGFDFPGMVARLTASGWPVELATSTALEAYRANLRMFDALMQMSSANAGLTGSGTVVVAAAGNESRVDTDPRFKIAASLPAAAQGVISVGALEQRDGKLAVASFSNIFPQLSAPGRAIVSARIGGGLTTMSGTSMACPHVAGVACLWWESLRKSAAVPATAAAVVARLLAETRTDVFAAGVALADRGAGLVEAPP